MFGIAFQYKNVTNFWQAMRNKRLISDSCFLTFLLKRACCFVPSYVVVAPHPHQANPPKYRSFIDIYNELNDLEAHIMWTFK